MIHIGALSILMERKDGNKRRVSFSLTFTKKNGEKVNVEQAVCTSTFQGKRTANIMLIPSMEVRTIYLIGITRINDQEVFV